MCLAIISQQKMCRCPSLCTIAECRVKFTVHRPMFSVQFAICISIIKCLKCAVKSLSSIVEDLRKSEHWTSCDNPPLPNPLVNWLTFNDQSSCRRFLANWQNKRKTGQLDQWPVYDLPFILPVCQEATSTTGNCFVKSQNCQLLELSIINCQCWFLWLSC